MIAVERGTTRNHELERRLEAFESEFVRNGTADLGDYLPPDDHVDYCNVLLELIRVDLEFAWDRGEERRLEFYRGRYPELFNNPECLRAAVSEEHRLRVAAGETPSPSEYGRRFGIALFDASASRLEKTIVTPVGAQPVPDGEVHEETTPLAGERRGGFTLIHEFGAGAFGKVFLARETGLANRLVVLKFSRKLPGESQTLARLQHSNIVPIYSVHQQGSFHVICMPWLGGTTFADLLDSIRGPGGIPASGQSVISTLHDRARLTRLEPASNNSSEDAPASPVEFTPVPAVLRQLEKASYTDAVLLFGEQLADGLAHAHERGVLHRDLKPANILLADDGRAMLLDFNLAADAELDGDAAANPGGTLRYMAPEAISALMERRGHSDPRADVYALGLILHELFTGTFPFASPRPGVTSLSAYRATRLTPPTDLRKSHPDLAPGVAAIIAKCLEPNAANRYPTATLLRDDLRRQRLNEPLAFAPNTSPRERLTKWSRRHPRLSSSVTLGMCGAVLLIAVITAFLVRQQRLNRLEATDAFTTLRSEKEALRLMLMSPQIPRSFAVEARDRSKTILERYDALNGVTAKSPLIRHLDKDEQAEATRDLGAVLYKFAAATRVLARTETIESRRTELNELWQKTVRNAEQARLRTPDITDRVGEFLAQGRYRKVIDTLTPSLIERDPNAAKWYACGIAHFRLGEYAEALRCFDVAAVLAPERPEILFSRGLTLQSAEQFAAAISDYDVVLRRHVNDMDSLLNRAICQFHQKDYTAALRDLDILETLNDAPSRLYFIREQVRQAAGDREGAARDFKKGLAAEPRDAISWVARGRAKLRLTPVDATGALADFEAATVNDPDERTAWENIAETLSERLQRPADAIPAQSKVIELAPDSASACAGRAVIFARLGRKSEALADVETAKAKKPDALALYQMSCAVILTATVDAQRVAGLDLLRTALRKDPVWAKSMATDSDLKTVHGASEFQKLIAAAAVLSPR
ncbi:hypothetical protein BH11PLA2_BH11PLA2_31530 [soil metagenome]